MSDGLITLIALALIAIGITIASNIPVWMDPSVLIYAAVVIIFVIVCIAGGKE